MNARGGCPAEALRAKAGCLESPNELRLGKPASEHSDTRRLSRRSALREGGLSRTTEQVRLGKPAREFGIQKPHCVGPIRDSILARLVYTRPAGPASAQQVRRWINPCQRDRMRPAMRFVYILRSVPKPERYYSGLTSDVSRRLDVHNSGGSRHTMIDRPWQLVASIEFGEESSAVAFEQYLKTGSGRAFAKRHFV